ncbi:alpha/beta hydrolase [Lactobacillus delbrueckii subsp. bulgaricus]|jgi:pimeloyl-ACP methyl ester carboxylesterase|nr:alpha/beta hydrolase [Lactobacillus delbrueckii subsp. bulgaricus]MBT8802213.1 alpha/beta hydrolase [Lactobacillus delbrueckii subsp. bulgaricus]MBT8810040.1 alpha/beta hydrolase [Lactobacillus delbrueckii subsp. bulgaricus]MBT8814794.1 alpha/beta hydrolase [Lactobacillus delbrueckii subsp. bulgaricus]MBT8827536.1 alpha/beta hydrolase [Lactobacillus delbrueckii subsp. bulgaricus]
MDVEIKRDGLTLRGILTKPTTATFNLVIIFHGFRGYKEDPLLEKIASKLEAAGLATLRFDFAGLGQSDGDFKDMTIFSELMDANQILAFAQKIPGVKKLFLLGHSQGGVIASMMAGYYADQISKLVLISPAATLVEEARVGKLQFATYDAEHIPSEIPLNRGYVAGGFYARTNRYMPIYEVAQHFEKPVFLIHVGNDQVVNEIASERYHALYQDSQLTIVKNADHSFYQADYAEQAAKLATNFLQEER